MTTKKELELLLEDKVVVSVLNDVARAAKRWDGGGALVHRVVAMGYLAESGARNIKGGSTPLDSDSTFGEMKCVDETTYRGMIDFLLPIVGMDLYSP